MTIGEKIKKIRLSMGLTQQQFASKLGLDENVGYKVVSKWETNVNKPTIETLKKISELTGKKILWFTDDEDDSENNKKSSIDEFLDRLLKEGIIKDPNKIEDDVADLILNAVKTDLQLRKLKKKEQ